MVYLARAMHSTSMESPIGSAENLHAGSRRIIRAEHLGIELVDLAEIRHVGQINRRLEHIGRVRANSPSTVLMFSNA